MKLLQALCLASVLGGVASVFGATSPAILVDEFIYEKAPYPSCHASTIVETAQGGLVAAWFGGTAEKHPDVGIWVARFDAATKTWTPGVEVANGVQLAEASQPAEVGKPAAAGKLDIKRYPTWNPVLFQPRGGAPLMLFYKVGPTPQTWWGMLRTSADDGKTWSEARQLPAGVLGPIKNKPVELADGTILAGTSMEVAKPLGDAESLRVWLSVGLGLILVLLWTLVAKRRRDAQPAAWWAFAVVGWAVSVSPVVWVVVNNVFRRPSEWQVHFERSTDGGETWVATPPLNDGTKLGAIQPSILFHDGIGGTQLQAVGRSRQGKVFTISSKDAGKSWDKMKLLDVPNPSSGTDAVTLKDGRHVLVCNPVPKGRTPLTVFVSSDGQQWKEAAVLESQPGEYSYPAVIQTSDGRVHITYTWKRQRVKHVVLDAGKL